MSDCDRPIPLGELLDWWLDDLPPERAEEIEDHFFSCASCTARLDGLRDLGAGVVALSRRGVLPMSGTSALLNRMSRDHRVLRQYTARPGQVISCSSSADDEWLVSRLRADFEGVEQVDLDVDDGQGHPIAHVDDVTLDRAAGEVVVLFPTASLESTSTSTSMFRIRLRDGDRLLGEYTFQHTFPDPPA